MPLPIGPRPISTMYSHVTTDSSGDGSFSAVAPGPVSVGDEITATATGTEGTSEFSECFQASACTLVEFPEQIKAGLRPLVTNLASAPAVARACAAGRLVHRPERLLHHHHHDHEE